MPLKGEIIVEYDQDGQEFVAFWEPFVLGTGKTERAAIEDMVEAAEFFFDITLQEIDAEMRI